MSLIGAMMGRGHDVTVVTFAGESTDFFTLPSAATRLSIDVATGRPTPFVRLLPRAHRSLQALRTVVLGTRPDAVIAHAPQINVPTLMALRDLPIPVIVTEHGDVSTRPDGTWLWKKWLWYRLRRLCYASAAKVVSVSEAVDRNFSWLPAGRRRVIHNAFAPIPRRGLPAVLPPGLARERPWIASMGRLSHAKGFDVLLDAFALISGRFARWQLLIIGDGNLRARLACQARELGLVNQVVFAGALHDPFTLLQHAKVFVMASRFEGFPMSHGEALACGLPVIAADCPSRPRRWLDRAAAAGGVRELVRHEVDGLLVPCGNPAALADAMAELMSNVDKRAALAARARDGAARFSLEAVVDQWERLLTQVCRT